MIVVTQSSAIEIFTPYSASSLCTFSPHLPITTLILSSGIFIDIIRGAYGERFGETSGCTSNILARMYSIASAH